MPINNPLPAGSVSGRSSLFFCFREPAEGFGSLYLYVSTYCFLTCLMFSSWVLGEGNLSYGFGAFDFSHEEVKQVVALVYRFVSLHS